ncbi:SET domain-containing protein [Punctularia strigosozonata HHB-11173 SS5]|uniref:SET domain-containing protein n=1 Tax=Punctularia strigosozonata (strain HHB-11173) TaxID=741275 RepID=UPI0004416A35|nr:SET domain-containing protein [Punctularia strigosozonata HHB-11173 SS5]EIN09090.1 SET domain-containing protein [Punctularia strigosozonata HHB-11173 SS5]
MRVDASAIIQDQEQTESAKPVDKDGLYACIPPTLDLRESPKSGRGLYVKVAIRRGSSLLSTRPHVSVLSTPYLSSHCSSCAAPASPERPQLKRCAKCHVVHYCSQKCQNADWKAHKPECDALQRWATAAPSPDLAVPEEAVRCLGRMLWQKQRNPSSIWSREIDSMQSHRSSLRPESFESHAYLAHALVRYLGLDAPEKLASFGLRSAGDVVDLISRFTTNAITLAAPSLTPLGVSVSPAVALVNHSCAPNAVVVFPRVSKTVDQEPVMQVIALRDIHPDEEVTTAYIDTTVPREQRQKILRDTYHFTCSCSLCAAEDPDPRESIWCPKRCGGTCSFPTEAVPLPRCLKCKAAFPSTGAIADAIRVGQEALDKATSLQFSDPSRALHLTSNTLPLLLSHGLAPGAHPLLALARLHQALLIDALSGSGSGSGSPSEAQEKLDETVRVAARTCAGLEAVLRAGHPVRAVALAELGKLLAADEPQPPPSAEDAFPPHGPPRLRLAHGTLLRALEELRIGFGGRNAGGEVGGEVREWVARLEKEMGVWRRGVRDALEDVPARASGS